MSKAHLHLQLKVEYENLKADINARLTEQIFDGGFCAFLCTKGDSGNLSGAAVC
jgi:hypothetical protein